MSEYAVVNPATGEELATYDGTTDAELEAALAAASAAHRGWSRGSTATERGALVRRVAELHRERREELADAIVREMGKPRAAALGEVEFAADIYEYYADRAEELLATSPSTCWAARAPRWCGAPRWGRCSGSCRGTSPTTRSPGSRARTSWWATPSCSSTPRSARRPPGSSSGSSPTPAAPQGAYTNLRTATSSRRR